MKITIRSQTVPRMAAWLKNARDAGIRDEAALRELLKHPDYQVEFARYGEPDLPVCGISYEEAVDFFLHFDEKKFDNPRLDYKQEQFLSFYRDLDRRLEKIQLLQSITEEELLLVQKLLENALPEGVLREVPEITVLLTVSIGNSMGWPYEHYVHFDAANLDTFHDKAEFLHVLAHELHHILFPRLLPEDMTPRQYFFLNFAFEGLAMHFCNNAETIGKPSKYPGESYGVDEESWQFFREQHRQLLARVLEDGERAGNMTMEQVEKLLEAYEQFTFTSLKTGISQQVKQYPTYYMGCLLWGKIDLNLGKERLFQVLASKDGFMEAWKEANQ